jgi:LysM repeat protein
MSKTMLYLFAALAIVLMVSVAWWTREYMTKHLPQVYVVQAGDTPQTIAEAKKVTAEDLASANDAQPDAWIIVPGKPITIPPPKTTAVDEWWTHLVGLGGTILGVFMSLWLALIAGLLPKPIRRQVLGISLVLGLTSYATTHAVAGPVVLLSPAFLFASIKDGFAWAAAFPMLARALGIRDAPGAADAGRGAPATEPVPVVEAPSGGGGEAAVG